MAPPNTPNPHAKAAKAQRMVGRCEMFDQIASGATATVHLGRMLGAGGFARTVAIKRLHPQYVAEPEFVKMFLDEARIVARIRHPNVIPILDLVEEEGNLFIIMEYVEGITFAQLQSAAKDARAKMPPGLVVRIVADALHGLHAAHEATNEKGKALEIVHRDFTPENIFLGVDGFPRVLDFGVARARGRLTTSSTGQIKGKLAYMAPEQLLAESIDRRTDVFAASVVLWQGLTGEKLFAADDLAELRKKLLSLPIAAPSQVNPEAPKKYDNIILRGLARELPKRWKTAQSMAEAIEGMGGLAPNREVGEWVRKLGAARLAELAAKVKALELKPVDHGSSTRRRVQQRSSVDIQRGDLVDAVAQAEKDKAASQASEASEAETRSEADRPPANVAPAKPQPGDEPDAAAAVATPAQGADTAAKIESPADPAAAAQGPSAEPKERAESQSDEERAKDQTDEAGAENKTDKARADEPDKARADEPDKARAELKSLVAVSRSAAEGKRDRRRAIVWGVSAALGVLIGGLGVVFLVRPSGLGRGGPGADAQPPSASGLISATAAAADHNGSATAPSADARSSSSTTEATAASASASALAPSASADMADAAAASATASAAASASARPAPSTSHGPTKGGAHPKTKGKPSLYGRQ